MTVKLYVNTDISLTINIGSGFIIDDVASMDITLTKNGATSGYTFSGQIGVDTVTVNIPDSGGITTAGTYTVKVLMTDTSGNIRGLTPTPEYLRFWP